MRALTKVDGMQLPPDILGNCPDVVRLRESLPGLSRLDIPVWVTGETGTGKNLFIRHLHRMSLTPGPLVGVSCASPSAELEIFGWAEGAFPWSHASHEGAMARASGGLLYLDSLPSLPMVAQERLLRAFKFGVFSPLGSLEVIPVSCRLACSGFLDLEEEIQRGSLREDLALLLSGALLHCPPLRERGPDIEDLARYFLRDLSLRHQRPAPALTRELSDRLHVHRWAGNLFELRNWVENLLLLGEFPECLPLAGADLTLADMERLLVGDTLRRHGGNRLKAAEALGIGERTLYRKIKQYKL